MTGGFSMKADCDGYGSSPQELAQAEQEADDLKALERGLAALKLAKEWLSEGGYVIPRLTDDIADIRLAIGLLRGREE